MLVKNFGQTRSTLLDSFRDLSDEQLNQKPNQDEWSISQILYHLYITERQTAELMLDSLNKPSPKIGERNLILILERSKRLETETRPPEDPLSKKELLHILEESRFQYVQAIFNEIHMTELVEKSIDHPLFGEVSLKNLADYICLHEQRHIKQIYKIRRKLS